jgi:ribosomal protein S18 acetylase RimI-like enzyme
LWPDRVEWSLRRLECRLPETIRIRRATKKDILTISKIIVEWLEWKVPRELSIRRAVKNKELLVADREATVVGFVHYVMHEDVVDGGLNAFITCFCVSPEFRNQRIGSLLLDRAIDDAVTKGAVGIETSTASPDARRLYERRGFKQFMGKWKMGEVFLELDMKKKRPKKHR